MWYNYKTSVLPCDFWYFVKSFCPAVDLLTVLSDCIAKTFNMSSATPDSRLIIVINLKVLGHSLRWFRIGNLRKNAFLMMDFLRAPFLILFFVCYMIKNYQKALSAALLSMVITLFYSRLDLWKQLEFTFELESDLWDTVDWGKKWLINFNVSK